jgi:hypothetical protein
MTPRTGTELLIAGTIAVWIAWDARAYSRAGIEATESQVIREWARHPLVTLAVGILLGHWFACPL